MTTHTKRSFRAGTALRALALLGAGAVAAGTFATPAMAQDYTRGVLAGTVVDEAGQPISGATVTVTSNDQGFQNQTTTDENGTFRVPALPTGTYTVVVESSGAVVVDDRGANVAAGTTNTYRYIAGTPSADQQAAASGNAIVVTGTRIQVDDFASTQTGALLNVTELAETVPVARNDTALILLAPGTVSGDSGFGNLASIGGATIAENAYYVNGLNVTDFRTFIGGGRVPFEFYESLDVKTGGYQAEYGRALGGVTSAVTKSGSNQFQAGAVIIYQPDFLTSDSPNTYLAENETDYTEDLEGNFYLSGPIIEDRLFFYGLYAPQYFKYADTSLSGQQRNTVTSNTPFYGAKIDAIITDGHRIEGTYFRDVQVQETTSVAFGPGGSDDLSGEVTRTTSEFGGDNFIGMYTGQFTDWLTLSAAYGEYHNQFVTAPNPNLAFISSQINPPAGLTSRRVQGGLSSLRNEDQDVRKFYRADADIYVDFLGEHHFRAGFDLEKLRSVEGTVTTGGDYRYVLVPTRVDEDGNPVPGYIDRTHYANAGSFRSDQRAFYIQDSWTLFNERLNLQLGVRNDSFKNYAFDGGKYFDSGDLWAPRIGASFDVFGDQRTKLNAFWGRYYLPVATNTNIRLGGAELFYTQRFGYPGGNENDANGDGIPESLTFDENGDITNLGPAQGTLTCPTVGPDGGEVCFSVTGDGTQGPIDTLVSSTLQPSYTDEFILGLSHRMGDWTFGVDYIRRRLGQTLEDVAVDAGVIAYCEANGIEGCRDEWTGFHQYVLANPGSDITVRLDGDCDIAGQCDVVTLLAEDLGYLPAERKYDAVQFTFNKAFNGLWGVTGSYTYTDLRGNYEGAVKSDINQTDAGLTQDFDQPGFQEGFVGDLANGRKHAFKLYGQIQPVDWLDIGVNVRVESPRKFSCIGNHPGGLDNFAFYYGVASFYCTQPDVGGEAVPNAGADLVLGTPDDGTSYLVPRSTALQSEWNRTIDLGLGFNLGDFDSSFGDSQFRIDIFNVFNWSQALDLNEFGDIGDFQYAPSPNYGEITGYQAPRSVRFTLAMRFGGGEGDIF